MVEVLTSATFDKWLVTLRDFQARARILVRLERLQAGNPGDVMPVGDGISEMRIPYGPGYRVYFVQHGPLLVVLLAGGDKSTQSLDIEKAKLIAKDWASTRSNGS